MSSIGNLFLKAFRLTPACMEGMKERKAATGSEHSDFGVLLEEIPIEITASYLATNNAQMLTSLLETASNEPATCAIEQVQLQFCNKLGELLDTCTAEQNKYLFRQKKKRAAAAAVAEETPEAKTTASLEWCLAKCQIQQLFRYVADIYAPALN